MINFGAYLSHLGIYSLLQIVRAQDLPYNPSRILISANSNDLAYVFLPSSATLDSKLLSLNISATINASNPDFKTITADLPFASDSAQAYTPVIDEEGGISVYAGDCASGASGTSLWKFTPESGKTNGTWTKSTFEVSSDVDSTDLPGANYLNTGFAFSTLLGQTSSLASIYIFGGMCPTATNTNVSTWQASANYSNHMLQFSPNTNTEYSLDLSGLSAPPISEAGFSLTPLKSTTSNSTSGTLTQQQNFVLLGGHTANAFTNFSQVAIFSLPEAAWSFQTIDSPSDISKRDTPFGDNENQFYHRSSAASIDSRSGHTAVLTEDGSKMVVFGGWVGDVSTSADPQLIVLELGAGYGGSGDWVWTIPSTSGQGIAAGTGIYGHGAVMLPGNVMMVLGGYSIPTSTSKRSAVNSDAYFFNATSMTWTSSYENPTTSTTVSSSPGSTSSSTAKEVGLGVGLSAGFCAIIIAGLVYLWYSRRLRRKRRHTREKDLRALSYGAATYCNVDPNNDPFASDGSHSSPYYNYNNAYLSDNVPGYENVPNLYNSAENDFDLNSPTPANRRNSTFKGKGPYQLAPTFDPRTPGSAGTAGPIHPIIEADEEELPFTLAGVGPDNEPDNRRSSITVAKRKPLSRPGTGDRAYTDSAIFNSRELDPLRSHPVSLHAAASGGNLALGGYHMDNRSSSNPSPESLPRPDTGAGTAAAEREAEIKDWVNDWAAADPLLPTHPQSQSHSSASNYGRLSPTRYRRAAVSPTHDENTSSSAEGRTESNISESARSAISNITTSINRSISQRSASLSAYLTGGGSSGIRNTPGTFSSSSPTAISPMFDRDRSYEALRGGAYRGYTDSSGTSFTTALTHNSFPALRAEGENLLPRPRPPSQANSTSKSKKEYSPSPERRPVSQITPVKQRRNSISPGKIRNQGVRSVSWLGSLRRVLTGATTAKKKPEIDSPLYWSDIDSPIRGIRGGYGTTTGGDGLPRRTVSAGATLWRRKQGKGDWEDSETPDFKRSSTLYEKKRNSVRWSGYMEGDEKGKGREEEGDWDGEEEEWDIERAVENRVVQVMFTVPKERLRVVNYDVPDDLSLDLDRERSQSIDLHHEHDHVRGRERSDLGGEKTQLLQEMDRGKENIEMSGARDGDVLLAREDKERQANRSPGRVREMVERFEERSGIPTPPTSSPISSRSPARR